MEENEKKLNCNPLEASDNRCSFVAVCKNLNSPFYLESSFYVLQVLYLLTRSRCRNKEGTRLGIGLANKKKRKAACELKINTKRNFGEWDN